MEPWQWLLLGVMLGWTPGLLLLALMLGRQMESRDE